MTTSNPLSISTIVTQSKKTLPWIIFFKIFILTFCLFVQTANLIYLQSQFQMCKGTSNISNCIHFVLTVQMNTYLVLQVFFYNPLHKELSILKYHFTKVKIFFF